MAAAKAGGYLLGTKALPKNDAAIAQMYRLMGEIHTRFNEYHTADIALSTSLYYEPGDAETWQRLGFVREQTGDLVYAEEAYRRALELNGTLVQARTAVDRLSTNQNPP